MPYSQTKSMTLCVARAMHAIHQAIVDKSYGGNCETDPAAFVRLAAPLQYRIRKMVHHSLHESLGMPLNWEAKVSNLIIADFEVTENFHISPPDMEYFILLGTVVVLAYEILLSLGEWQGLSTREFLTRSFEIYFCEPYIGQSLAEFLMTEKHRLGRAGADKRVQLAVYTLQDLVQDLSNSSSLWTESRLGFQSRTDAADTEPIVYNSPSLQKNMSGSTILPQDLLVKVFLRPGCSIPLDFVNFLRTSKGGFEIKTCNGIRMEVLPGFEVSSISGIFDTVTVQASEGNSIDFAATVFIPAGCLLRATEIEDVTEIEGKPRRAVIRGKQAIFEFSDADGGYSVSRGKYEQNLFIQNTS
ncbi:hypothetical protein GQ44DRAFT_777543 [Phaeosphaeriaceae sp. PMI808]|nr:hypothetical protein GQ44DRAFT_777543 [Phaeosphaeriaceae sp. PMI808]